MSSMLRRSWSMSLWYCCRTRSSSLSWLATSSLRAPFSAVSSRSRSRSCSSCRCLELRASSSSSLVSSSSWAMGTAGLGGSEVTQGDAHVPVQPSPYLVQGFAVRGRAGALAQAVELSVHRQQLLLAVAQPGLRLLLGRFRLAQPGGQRGALHSAGRETPATSAPPRAGAAAPTRQHLHRRAARPGTAKGTGTAGVTATHPALPQPSLHLPMPPLPSHHPLPAPPGWGQTNAPSPGVFGSAAAAPGSSSYSCKLLCSSWVFFSRAPRRRWLSPSASRSRASRARAEPLLPGSLVSSSFWRSCGRGDTGYVPSWGPSGQRCSHPTSPASPPRLRRGREGRLHPQHP